MLGSAAKATFGARAEDLTFLRFHGQGSRTTTVRLADDRAEMHA